MQRIEVTEDGFTLTVVEEARYSVFGNEVYPRRTSVTEQPWDDIYRIRLTKVDWWPEEPPRICLEVDLTYGEYFEVTEDAEGFGEAVAEICRQVGVPVPDWTAVPDGGLEIL
ncbi:hypothetical protein [Actinoplanes utahensis]|uniref:Uncharacterized protein n=1 Tax=Actinoplanes utahensis TaxID=1869 RepID=A0A0A6UHJ7_ACTUT|nr:hypothetical protein [Actinoplanes utahensis]KHD74573.1 hypothetical protein MB27_28125 [Actinoplanes utahensis]GIF35365.1 hypothetical protein Aut01nite_83510 [Actinoplanes utahensis]